MVERRTKAQTNTTHIKPDKQTDRPNLRAKSTSTPKHKHQTVNTTKLHTNNTNNKHNKHLQHSQ